MSPESGKDDHQPDVIESGRAGRAAGWLGGWAADPVRRVKCIAPLNSFASLGSGLRSRRPLVVAGISVLGLLGGAGAALATTSAGTPAAAPSTVAATPSPGATPQPGQPHRMFGHGLRGFGRMAFGPAGLGLAGPGALHGQVTVRKPGGGFQTVDIQRGQVTAVSATSITLRSADGYSHSYAISDATIVDAQRGGISSVKTGHQASLVATVSGSTATAVRVQDQTLMMQGRQHFGFGGQRGAHWTGPNPPSQSSGGQPG
ncbi:MAG TPA: hypothetical protein VH637_23935 [Streptosporangiaceae bacterium]|jgi:hypothetical protein